MQVVFRTNGSVARSIDSLLALAGEAAIHSGALAEMERALTTLRSTRLRVTLIRLALPKTQAALTGTARRVADGVDHPSMICGTLGAGEVLALHVGPRAPGRAGDQAVAEAMTRYLFQAVKSAGLELLADWAEVAIDHAWTDEIIDLQHWLAETTAGAGAVAA